jgi:hypothetical protein
MTEVELNQGAVSILAVFGFGLQWLRARPWFNDGWTIAAAVIAGLLASILTVPSGTDIREAIVQGFILVPSVLGGTFAAHIAAHHSDLVPRFNAYSKEATDEAPPAAPGTAA